MRSWTAVTRSASSAFDTASAADQTEPKAPSAANTSSIRARRSRDPVGNVM
ncbi:hypothetical protein [Gordonia araii]|uniref:hypothetical protein n=1 Tax=Gordonia araii TaxID=263909 RepID=UPI0014781B78|nr:hypothetical protein [Gordonia araii]NNG98767.1 hypothetical protein [Gordonia araii NBRC 100433]